MAFVYATLLSAKPIFCNQSTLDTDGNLNYWKNLCGDQWDKKIEKKQEQTPRTRIKYLEGNGRNQLCIINFKLLIYFQGNALRKEILSK